ACSDNNRGKPPPDGGGGVGGVGGESTPMPWSGTAACSPDGFCAENPLPLASNLVDVWAAGPSDVWAVGGGDRSAEAGVILRFNGSSWSAVTPAAQAGQMMRGVYGFSRNDVHLVRDGWP